MYYEEFGQSAGILCPETGDVNYGGSMGTNLWVIPVKDSDDYNIYNDATPYENNEVTIWYSTESFKIGDYVKGDDHMSYHTKKFTRYILDDAQEVSDYLNVDYVNNDRQIVSIQVS